jgi:pimeloyl-ACP methyl ester carboxylesterase
MTVVLVHGNPETPDVWDLLIPHLTPQPVVRLSPPGFGAPVPEGFGATVTDYRDWLIGELAALPGPVDLVGHDWGGCHVLNAVMVRPDLVRSWASDVVGGYDPDYEWHDLAQVWQRPGEGEEWVDRTLAAPAERRAAGLAGLGVDPVVAGRVAAGIDRAMGDCLLRLYRSAAQPVLARLGAGLDRAAQRPGMAILATEDHFMGGTELCHRAAARANARVEVLDGLGHWWMAQDPARGAEALNRFWASL